MSPLRTKMIQDMQLRRFSPNTQEAYIQAVVGLARFHRRSPDRLNQEQVLEYLLYLMTEGQRSWSTCNVVASGLRFFYHVTLAQKTMDLIIPPRKTPHQLPEIFSFYRILWLVLR